MNGEPVNSYHGACRPYNGFLLSYTGALVDGIEIDGIDPDDYDSMSYRNSVAWAVINEYKQYILHYSDLGCLINRFVDNTA